ncbi:hypothetical protein ABFS82_13G133400 [Erythranthe guttata]|uniref:Cystatin domain-containing protein n=1 Tax=Erythranthe guttata TaxID=4155 RepID=A0A022QG37_ERYGU|nr:PREDICTED: cysteine proteinase inhibitor 5-like [Erythranthe guttata]EYU27692.1 hypothetical protein MIMGU_mgv1a016470mg [Erythranthe guttata]|eukprot:XP_012848403.1 PREDICTED: cysteine proteinase inhibitor 5-like [Erythranthe guttata]
MALKSRSVLFLLLSIMVVSSINEAGATFFGIWLPIANLKTPEVVQIAKFAVAEHNKEAKTSLQFVTVVRGETKLAVGKNYRLVITVKGSGSAQPKNYTAVVWSRPLIKYQQLLTFNEVKV